MKLAAAGAGYRAGLLTIVEMREASGAAAREQEKEARRLTRMVPGRVACPGRRRRR